MDGFQLRSGPWHGSSFHIELLSLLYVVYHLLYHFTYFSYILPTTHAGRTYVPVYSVHSTYIVTYDYIYKVYFARVRGYS